VTLLAFTGWGKYVVREAAIWTREDIVPSAGSPVTSMDRREVDREYSVYFFRAL
jgi:hypothetical protein